MTGIANIFQGLQGLAGGNTQFFNPVEQAGGITPYEQDFTQYGYQENLLADASNFAGSGTGLSTMATQAATGSRLGQAQEQGRISDVNAGAILNATQVGESASAATNQLNQSDLAGLAKIAQGFNTQSNANNSFNAGAASVTS